MRCLANNREDRYPTARALANDLKRLLRTLSHEQSLEEYIQGVLDGSIGPTPLDDDLRPSGLDATADIVTPVPALSLGSEFITFEDSTDTLEAPSPDASEGQTTTQLSGDSELVLESVSDGEAPTEGSAPSDSDEQATEQAAPALAGNTVQMRRTNPKMTGKHRIGGPGASRR